MLVLQAGTMHRKQNFPLKTSPVYVTKSAVNCIIEKYVGEITYTGEIFNRKLHLLCSETFLVYFISFTQNITKWGRIQSEIFDSTLRISYC